MEPQSGIKAKVSSKGWVVIPARLRKRYKIEPGSLVEFREMGDNILIVPEVSDAVETLYGSLAGAPSLTKALREERTKELEREEADLCA